MYKSTLLQLLLIIVGLFTAVTGVQNLLQKFIAIIVWNPDTFTGSAVMGLLISGTYFLIAFFLITRSKEWADAISKRSRLHGDFSINAHPSEVLYFILIGVGFFSLIRAAPYFIYHLYEAFAGKVERFTEHLYRQDIPDKSWTLLTLEVLIPLIIILSARPIANYFAAKMTDDPIEIKEENQSTDL